MCVCGLGCVPRRTVPRRTAQTRLSQPACRLLARCRAGAAAAGVARVRALLQGHAPLPVAQAPGQVAQVLRSEAPGRPVKRSEARLRPAARLARAGRPIARPERAMKPLVRPLLVPCLCRNARVGGCAEDARCRCCRCMRERWWAEQLARRRCCARACCWTRGLLSRRSAPACAAAAFAVFLG